MAVWVSLLRGINLGSHNKVPMPALREALVEAGFRDVRTHLQSGNVVTTSRHRTPDRVAALVRGVVESRFGIDVPVVVRSPEQLRAVLEWNPFPEAAAERPKLVQVMHLFATPAADDLEALLAAPVSPERIAVRDAEVVVDYVDNIHASKVTGPWLTKRLGGVDATARNWRTLTALCELTG